MWKWFNQSLFINRHFSSFNFQALFSNWYLPGILATRAPFIWSRVAETAPAYSFSDRANFLLTSLKFQLTVYKKIWSSFRGASCLAVEAKIALLGRTTFFHFYTSTHPPKTKELKSCPTIPFVPEISSAILLTVCHTIPMMLARRIWYWINQQSPKWYFSSFSSLMFLILTWGEILSLSFVGVKGLMTSLAVTREAGVETDVEKTATAPY